MKQTIVMKLKAHVHVLLLFGVILLAGMTMSCSSDDNVDGGKSSSADFDERVAEKPGGTMKLGAAEELVVNEQNCTVEAAGCTIELTPCMLKGDTKLLVAKATQVPWMLSKGDNVTAVNVQVGDLTEYNGVAHIRIPISFSKGQTLVAAQWNEVEKDWTPALCEYDKKKGEAVVLTDKPGTFGVMVVDGSTRALTRAGEETFGAFIVARANTRAAGLFENKFHYVDWEDPPLTVITGIMSELFGGNNELTSDADIVTQDILDTKSLFGDITYPLLKEAGLGNALLKKTAGVMGNLAVVATFYQKLRAVYSGDVDKADGMTLKALTDWFVKKGTTLCESSAMTLCMVSVAIIDYSLNKFAEEAWSGRKDMYKKAFDLYYSEGEDGYRSFQEWYDLFWPAFTKKGMTEIRLNALIDAYVNKYCEQFWENEETVAYYLGEATGTVWTGGGGLNEKIKKELSAELRGKLYSDPELLPSVFDAIGEKLKLQQYDLMKDQMMKYAQHANGIITLHFKDVDAKNGNSAFAGHTVKFKKLPLRLEDPTKWECKLDKNGEGDIKFRLFAYCAAGVKPDMVIVSPDGEEKLTLKLSDLEVGVNEVKYGAGFDARTDIEEIKITYDYETTEYAYGKTATAHIPGSFKLNGDQLQISKTANTYTIKADRQEEPGHEKAKVYISFTLTAKITAAGMGEITSLVADWEWNDVAGNKSLYSLDVSHIQWNPEFSRSNYYYWLTTEKDGLETKLFYCDFDNKRIENYYLKDYNNYVAVTIKFK